MRNTTLNELEGGMVKKLLANQIFRKKHLFSNRVFGTQVFRVVTLIRIWMLCLAQIKIKNSSNSNLNI